MEHSLFAQGQCLLVFIFASIIIFSLFLADIRFMRVFKLTIHVYTRPTENPSEVV